MGLSWSEIGQLPFIVNSNAVKPTIKATYLSNMLQQSTQRANLLSRHTVHTVRQELHGTVLSSVRAMGTQPDVDRENYNSVEHTQFVQTYGHVKQVILYHLITMKLRDFI
jgi:hypothetical protein